VWQRRRLQSQHVDIQLLHVAREAHGDRLPVPVEVDAPRGYDFTYGSFAVRNQQKPFPNSTHMPQGEFGEERGKQRTVSIANGIKLSVWE